jgi:hypothetical protein
VRRRDLLGSLGLAGVGGLAGCLDAVDDRGRGPGTPTPTPAPRQVATGFGDVELPVNGSEIETRLPRDAIPAITDPAFGEDWSDWSAVPEEHRPETFPTLDDAAPVVGVERDGEVRAYPLRILDHHEVVNDLFEPRSKARRTRSDGGFGGPLLVTYCPLCGSAVVAVRRIRGEVTSFGVSGKLWRNDLVLYDEATGSLWSQLLATAIRGPATGETLRLVPASLTTWSEWRDSHPDTRVLLPPPASATVAGRDSRVDYADSKYGYEEEAQVVGYDAADGYALVVGVVHGGEAVAYPFEAVQEAGVVNDRVGDLPVVVAATSGGSLVAYERVVGGETLRFAVVDDRHLRAGGSRWARTTGRAVDGPHEGTRLVRASERSPLFHRAWVDFHPDSRLWSPTS